MVRLQYRTAWGKAFVHFQPDGGEWTQEPVALMPISGPALHAQGLQNEPESGSVWKEIVVPAAGMRFVCTNGEGW
eukprot:7633495-Pyramimonas_sp.AAC.1